MFLQQYIYYQQIFSDHFLFIIRERMKKGGLQPHIHAHFPVYMTGTITEPHNVLPHTYHIALTLPTQTFFLVNLTWLLLSLLHLTFFIRFNFCYI